MRRITLGQVRRLITEALRRFTPGQPSQLANTLQKKPFTYTIQNRMDDATIMAYCQVLGLAPEVEEHIQNEFARAEEDIDNYDIIEGRVPWRENGKLGYAQAWEGALESLASVMGLDVDDPNSAWEDDPDLEAVFNVFFEE